MLNLDVKPGETDWTIDKGIERDLKPGAAKHVLWVCASLTPDASGKEAMKVTTHWIDRKEPYLLLDLPRKANISEATPRLTSLSFTSWRTTATMF